MGKISHRQRLRIWIACFAILLNALVPSISHAVNALQGRGALVEICSAEGARYVVLDGAARHKSPLDAVLHHMEHCPCCVADAAAPPLPPRFSKGLPAPVAIAAVFPSLFYLSPAPQFAWAPAHPRGPPA